MQVASEYDSVPRGLELGMLHGTVKVRGAGGDSIVRAGNVDGVAVVNVDGVHAEVDGESLVPLSIE